MSFLFDTPPKTPEDLPTLKYYPIFDKRWQTSVKNNENVNTVDDCGKKKSKSCGKITTVSETKMKRSKRTQPYARKNLFNANEQYCLDLGQKNFDAQQCKVCKMLYCVGEAVDEKTHEEYHDMFVNSLKYHNWKHENVVNRYTNGKILRVTPSSPHYMHKKLDELFKVADLELGINSDLKSSMKTTSQFYVFISLPSKRFTGFVAAERIQSANRLLSENPLMASTDEFPAEVGVSRIWTHPNFRRKKIATCLLDTLRQCFFKSKILPKTSIAFSDPTVVGKDFAKKYTGMDKFLIYLYKHEVEETNSKLIDQQKEEAEAEK